MPLNPWCWSPLRTNGPTRQRLRPTWIAGPTAIGWCGAASWRGHGPRLPRLQIGGRPRLAFERRSRGRLRRARHGGEDSQRNLAAAAIQTVVADLIGAEALDGRDM